MYNVIVWGTGPIYSKCLNTLKRQELAGAVKVMAVISDDISIHSSIDGYPLISKEKVLVLGCDYCLVSIENISTVFNEANRLGIEKNKLIPMGVLSFPGFEFEKYISIKESRPTILSCNCWAGFCYHRLGLEFLSPTINMYFAGHDFNKFVADLDYYLSLPVQFAESAYDKNLKRDYPVCRLGGEEGIKLYCNHYIDFDHAKECWEKRKRRINYDNILVVSYTESLEEAVEFEKLPYPKKIIFTSFESDLESSIYLERDTRWATFGEQTNMTVIGNDNILELLYCLNEIVD